MDDIKDKFDFTTSGDQDALREKLQGVCDSMLDQNTPEQEVETDRAFKLTIVFSILIIIIFAIIIVKLTKPEPGKSLLNILLFNRLLPALVSSYVFGFIDNAGLFVGIDAIEGILKKMGLSNKAVAGFGNTFSDLLGAFIGGAFGVMLGSVLPGGDIESTPFQDAIGVTLGALTPVLMHINGIAPFK